MAKCICEYYCPVLSSEERTHRKIFYCLAYLLTVIVYGYVATRQMEINITRWVGICHGFTALALLWLLMAVVSYGTAKEKMSVTAYKAASVRLKQLSFAAAVLFGLMAMGYLVFTIIGMGSWMDFLKLFPVSLLGSGIMFLMYFVENKTTYEVIQETIDVPEDKEEMKD